MPFGLAFNSYSSGLKNDYLYNGKELQDELDLNLYDYGARFYDPNISRFLTLDPKTEIYSSWSPYLYGANNPVRYEDTNGEGPGDKVLGFVSAYVDNVLGGVTPLREMAGQYVSADGAADFNSGQDWGDAAAIVVGIGAVDTGGGMAAGGTGATVVSGGVLGEIGVPVAVAGLAIAAEGAVMTRAGAINLASQKGRLNAEGEGSGSYTNTHESGKRYHGKGGEDRAKQSAERVAKQNNDPASKTDWEPAKTDREAFKQEAQRIENDGGVKNTGNYNKINSPGKKYIEKDKGNH